MNRTWSILIFDKCVRSFPRLNMEFTVKLVGFRSDGAAPQKARLPRFPFQSSGIRVNNEPIRGPTMCPSVRPHKGQHIPPLSPNPIRFYGLSIDQPVGGRSVDQRLSYQRNQLTINQELASVRPSGPSLLPPPFPLPQFVFGFGKRLACLKAANMIERLSV